MPDKDSWNNYEQLVLSELKRHNSDLGTLNSKVDEIRTKDIPHVLVSIAAMRTELSLKSGFWGLIAGCIPVAIMIAIRYL